ncbi:MAG: ABC transporter substrate-binding protein [Ilumatobacteraceae bacterium]
MPIDGCEVRQQRASIGEMNTHVFAGPQSWEVTEIGLLPYLLAYANDGFRDYTLLPLFPLRLFRHKSIFIRTDKGITRPEDLRGKRVGTSGYSTTSLTWIRGMLEHDYGIKPTELRWVLSDEDSSAGLAGRRSEHERELPHGIDVSHGTAGKSESDLLVDDEVDVLFHAAEPQAFVDGHPLVSRLFPDSRAVERAYYAKTGIFPTMHAVAIRADIASANPWLPEALFRAFVTAKRAALQRLRTMGWAMISLPWVAQEEEATRQLMGENFWPYGLEQNRTTLTALLQYAHEQGLTPSQVPVNDLFHPASLELTDNT